MESKGPEFIEVGGHFLNVAAVSVVECRDETPGQERAVLKAGGHAEDVGGPDARELIDYLREHSTLEGFGKARRERLKKEVKAAEKETKAHAKAEK